MSKHDPFSLFFDTHVPDHDNGVCIEVTRCDEKDEHLQFTIRSLDSFSPRTSAFVTLAVAEQIAHTLLEAVNATLYIDPHQAMAYGTGFKR